MATDAWIVGWTGSKVHTSLNCQIGTSLAIQWLELLLLMQSVLVQSLAGKLRSHMPYGVTPQKIFSIVKWYRKKLNECKSLSIPPLKVTFC